MSIELTPRILTIITKKNTSAGKDKADHQIREHCNKYMLLPKKYTVKIAQQRGYKESILLNCGKIKDHQQALPSTSLWQKRKNVERMCLCGCPLQLTLSHSTVGTC